MRTRKILSLLVAMTLIIGLVAVPALAEDEATIIELGDPTVINTYSPVAGTEKGWGLVGTDGTNNAKLTADELNAAKYLVLELSAPPTGKVRFNWNANGDSWKWHSLYIVDENGTDETTLVIDLTTVECAHGNVPGECSGGDDSFAQILAASTQFKFLIGYYSDTFDDLGIVKAYLTDTAPSAAAEEDEDGEDDPAEAGDKTFDNFVKSRTYEDGVFTDLDTVSWGQDNIKGAYEFNIMDGVGNNKFNPAGKLTALQALIIGAKIHAIYTTGGTDIIDADEYAGEGTYDKFVNYCKAMELVGDEFDDALTANITRAQMVHAWSKILDAADMEAQNTFVSVADVAEDAEYYDDIKYFYEAGILSGSGGKFSPDGEIDRVSAASIFLKLLDKAARNKDMVFEYKAPEAQVIELPDFVAPNAGWTENYIYDENELTLERGQAFKLEFTVELKAGTRFFLEAPQQPGNNGGYYPAMRNADSVEDEGPMGNGYLAAESAGVWNITWYGLIEDYQIKAFNHASSPEAVTMTNIVLTLYIGEDDPALADGEWEKITYLSEETKPNGTVEAVLAE